MTEKEKLNTLEDLKFEITEKDKDMKELINCIQDFFHRDLRAEAMRWIRAEKPELFGIPILEVRLTAEQVRDCIKDWIKYFFNLTNKKKNDKN